MKSLALLVLFATSVAHASPAFDQVSNSLHHSISFANGYAESVGHFENSSEQCLAFVSLERAGTIQLGIMDGDYHASETFTADQVTQTATGYRFHNPAKRVEATITTTNGRFTVEINELEYLIGFIPRHSRVACR